MARIRLPLLSQPSSRQCGKVASRSRFPAALWAKCLRPGRRSLRARSLRPGHLPAAFRTLPAGADALFHVSDVLATARARLTHLCAHSAHLSVHVRVAQHEIGSSLADVRTIQHQAKVMRLNVPAACFETVIHRHFATDPVAVQTVLNTFLHRLVQSSMCHSFLRSVLPAAPRGEGICSEAEAMPVSGAGARL